MDSQPLYDLAPLAQMMLLGIVIALGPVAWVGWRHRGSARGHRLQALTVLTLFLLPLLYRHFHRPARQIQA